MKKADAEFVLRMAKLGVKIKTARTERLPLKLKPSEVDTLCEMLALLRSGAKESARGGG